MENQRRRWSNGEPKEKKWRGWAWAIETKEKI